MRKKKDDDIADKGFSVSLLALTLDIFSNFFFSLFRAAPVAYGDSQAKCPIRTAASLHHSHSNAGSKPCLPSTSQLMAISGP